MKEQTQIVGTRAYRVRTSETGDWGYCSWQPVNPKTGLGWQAPRDTQTFHGPRAAAKATRAWLYAVLRAKKASR